MDVPPAQGHSEIRFCPSPRQLLRLSHAGVYISCAASSQVVYNDLFYLTREGLVENVTG